VAVRNTALHSKLLVAELVKTFPVSHEAEVSLQPLHNLATGFYPKADDCSPRLFARLVLHCKKLHFHLFF
jgi:hypothetical protein